MRAGLTLRLAIFSGLTLPLWLVSGSSHADRVLSLTVVGDGRGPNLTAEQPALTSPAGTGPADVPTDRGARPRCPCRWNNPRNCLSRCRRAQGLT